MRRGYSIMGIVVSLYFIFLILGVFFCVVRGLTAIPSISSRRPHLPILASKRSTRPIRNHRRHSGPHPFPCEPSRGLCRWCDACVGWRWWNDGKGSLSEPCYHGDAFEIVLFEDLRCVAVARGEPARLVLSCNPFAIPTHLGVLVFIVLTITVSLNSW